MRKKRAHRDAQLKTLGIHETMDSFIINFWQKIFSGLYRFTPFGLLNWHLSVSHGWVEVWVLTHFFLAFGSWLSASVITCEIFRSFVFVYAVARIAEIVIYQIKVILFDPFQNQTFALRSYRRSILLSMQTFVEVLLWFAAIYRLYPDDFSKPDVLRTVNGSLYFSAVTMATLGYGDITPSDNSGFGHWLIVYHIGVGLFLTIVVIARFISLLPKPGTLADDEHDHPD